MCVSNEETKDLLETARASGVRIGVNHSMLFVPAYARLRTHVQAGDIGPIDYLNITTQGARRHPARPVGN